MFSKNDEGELSKMAKTLCEVHYEIKYENNH